MPSPAGPRSTATTSKPVSSSGGDQVGAGDEVLVLRLEPAAPVAAQPPGPGALDVGPLDHEVPARLQRLGRRAQLGPGVTGVLQVVVHADHVVGAGQAARQVREQAPVGGVDPAPAGGLLHRPAEVEPVEGGVRPALPGGQAEVPVAGAHVEPGPGLGVAGQGGAAPVVGARPWRRRRTPTAPRPRPRRTGRSSGRGPAATGPGSGTRARRPRHSSRWKRPGLCWSRSVVSRRPARSPTRTTGRCPGGARTARPRAAGPAPGGRAACAARIPGRHGDCVVPCRAPEASGAEGDAARRAARAPAARSRRPGRPAPAPGPAPGPPP